MISEHIEFFFYTTDYRPGDQVTRHSFENKAFHPMELISGINWKLTQQL